MRHAIRTSGFVAAMACSGVFASAEVPGASEVLDRSIAYHDPHGDWGRTGLRLAIRETRPDGTERRTRILINAPLDSFEIQTQRDGAEIEGLMAGEQCLLTLDGSAEFSDEQRNKYRLTCENLGWLRNYYTYLWGLPMKLRDPGTRLDPKVIDTSYRERPVWAIRVKYDPKVGTDTWYFYFDPQTYALVGYRFYHDEALNDGEYILLQGEIEDSGMRLPARRAWYVNADDRYLGDDTLTELRVEP